MKVPKMAFLLAAFALSELLGPYRHGLNLLSVVRTSGVCPMSSLQANLLFAIHELPSLLMLGTVSMFCRRLTLYFGPSARSYTITWFDLASLLHDQSQNFETYFRAQKHNWDKKAALV